MSELKRNHSLFRQSAPAACTPRRSEPVAIPLDLATEPAELRLLDSWDSAAVEGGDPYNGTGSRAILRHPPVAPAAPPTRK